MPTPTDRLVRTGVRNVTYGLVLCFAVLGVRLNERDASRTAASTAAAAVSSTSYAQDIRNWRLQLAGCGRSVMDRTDLLRQARASRTANLIVANDPRQPDRTRNARRVEADAYLKSIHGFNERLPPRFFCAVAYPKPLAPRGVNPLP